MVSSEYKLELQAAILGLEFLLETKEMKEAEYQRFFETNPVIFSILGYDQSVAFTKESNRSLPRDNDTGLKPEPDFLVKRPNELWEIFELKTPISKTLMITSNKYRERFTAEVLSYISQTITYENYFTRNPSNRKKVREQFGVTIQEDLDIKIVIGLSKSIDRKKIHKACRQLHYKVDIITYDEILDRLEDEYKCLFGIFENLDGFSFHAIVRFCESTQSGSKFFLDVGADLDHNRVSFFINEKSDISFNLRDQEGRVYDLGVIDASTNFLNEWVYLVCEFGYTDDSFIMLVYINGVETDLRKKDHPINLKISFDDMVLGADMSFKNFGFFDIAEKCLYSRTMTFKEHRRLLGYFSSTLKEVKSNAKYISFTGSMFMKRDEKGNFVQPDDSYKPKFITK